MGWTAVSGVTSSISVAVSIAKGMAGLRDQALINEKTSALLDQLLKAQEGLLAHNTALLQIQSDLSEMQQENLKLKASLNERSNYTLVELSKGSFALQRKLGENFAGADAPSSNEAPHYICQPCFTRDKTVVLQGNSIAGISNGLICPACKTQVFD